MKSFIWENHREWLHFEKWLKFHGRERGMHVHEPFNIIGVSPFHEKIVSYDLGVSLKLLCVYY